ncbi:hypothetical protein HRbin11_00325 [bacterium HR11]|nr:hypothetical protein HRbin11_00325 [bacterium HR11]
MRRTAAFGWISVLMAFGPAQAVRPDVRALLAHTYTVGDSITAGWMHGTWMDRFSACAYPALIARQAGLQPFTEFTMPRVSFPGWPGYSGLRTWVPYPVWVQYPGMGALVNPDVPPPLHNLAIPGMAVQNLLQGEDPSFPPSVWVLRGAGSVTDQLQRAPARLVTVWVGTNDAGLPLALGSVVPGLTPTPVEVYERSLRAFMSRVYRPEAQFILMTVPDPTWTPRCHLIPPYVRDPHTGQPVRDARGQPVPLIGPDGRPLDPSTCVMEQAIPYLQAGYGIPAAYGGNGQGLPHFTILDPDEQAFINAHVRGYNEAIRRIAAEHPENVFVFDLYALYDRIRTQGYLIGGIRIDFSYPLGGFYGHDPYHPSPIGHAVIAEELIRFLHERLGLDLPSLDLRRFLSGQECPYPGVPSQGPQGPTPMMDRWPGLARRQGGAYHEGPSGREAGRRER